MSLKLVTAPSEEPVSLDEAKLHLKLASGVTSPPSTHPDDAIIVSLIETSRIWCESFQHRSYITQTWTLYLDRFPSGRQIEIPLPPLQQISSLSYKDENDTLQIVSFLDTSGSAVFETDDYIIDVASEPGRLCIKNGRSWPNTSCNVQAVQLQFIAGYGAAADVPKNMKSAILLKLSDLYENRGDAERQFVTATKVDVVKALLWADRITHR